MQLQKGAKNTKRGITLRRNERKGNEIKKKTRSHRATKNTEKNEMIRKFEKQTKITNDY